VCSNQPPLLPYGLTQWVLVKRGTHNSESEVCALQPLLDVLLFTRSLAGIMGYKNQ